jgi:hypothetical protein
VICARIANSGPFSAKCLSKKQATLKNIQQYYMGCVAAVQRIVRLGVPQAWLSCKNVGLVLLDVSRIKYTEHCTAWMKR